MNDGDRPVILIVEDEWLIATDLADTVEAAGYTVLGPAHNVTTALELLETSPRIDGGLLDVNIRGESVYPVAEALERARIPFAFLSGYASDQLSPAYSTRPLLSKPLELRALNACLAQMLRPA